MTTYFTGTIALGQSVQGSLSSNQRYRYSFELDSLQTLRILLDGRDSFDAYLRIYDSSDRLLYFNDDGGGDRDSLITRQFSAGRYTIEAASYNDFSRGSYALSVISLSGPPAAAATNTLLPHIGTNSGTTPTLASGGVTRDRTVELSGTFAPGFAVEIYDNGTLLSSSTSGGASWQIQGSAWRYTTPALAEAFHTLRADFKKAGESTQSREVQLTVDATILGSMSGTLSTDQGAIGSGETTTDHTLGLSGFAEPDAQVLIYDGSRLLGQATYGNLLPNGSVPWSFTTPSLSDGRHVLTAVITDQAGNSTTVGNLAATVVTGDVALGETVTGSLTSGVRQQYKFTLDSDQVVRVFLDGRTLNDAYLRIYDVNGVLLQANDDGGGNLDSLIERTFAAGIYTAEAASFGDYGIGTYALSLSTNSLSRSVLTNTGATNSVPDGGLTKDNTLTLTGARIGATLVEILDGTGRLISSSAQGGTSWVLSGGQWRYTTGVQADGLRTFKARFTSGTVVTEQSLSVTVDTVVTGSLSPTLITNPATQASVQSGGSTTAHSLGLSGTAEPNSMVEIFDGSKSLGKAQLNEGNWSFQTPDLLDGLRTLTAKITDAAGNVLITPAVTVTLSTVDTQAPTFAGGALRQLSVPENSAGVVYTPSVRDNVDSTVSRFEFAGGADDSRFNINASTGAISFKNPPDFEAPLNPNNVYVTKIRAKDAAGNAAVQEVRVTVTDVNETSDDSYTIELIYTGDANYRQYFVDAAKRWSTIITGDLPNVGSIDDLRVNVTVGNIDGPGGAAGSAYATAWRDGIRPTDRLAYEGEMSFDIADIPRSVETGVFADIVLHELGHVLGFTAEGFEAAGLLDKENPLRYVGSNALAKYRSLAGVVPSAAYIPLEDTGGPGTRGHHWSEALFGNELMTGYIRGAANLPLSSVTIGALKDLGYQVDESQAEPFRLASVLTPGFAVSQATASVVENFNVGTPVGQWQVTGTVEGYEVAGPDGRLFRVDSQGRVFFRESPDFERPRDAWGSNEYHITLYAQAADNARAILPVTVTVSNVAAPSSSEAFTKWQEAEQRAAGDLTKSIQAYNQHSAEIVAQRDNTSRDGVANQAEASKRLTQWIDRVTGTDIVSEAEYRDGIVITGKALPGKKDTIQFLLDSDRTDGIDGKDAIGFRPGISDRADISYDNDTGDWRIALVSVSNDLQPAAANVFGSGVHQLVVDIDGDDILDPGEASRLFLVAGGTAASTDTGTVATNFSVQDKITGDVFVYYFGDPDGAGVGMSTLLDYRAGPSGTDTAANPGVVFLNRDGSSGGGDADYYANISSYTSTAAATASNMAARLVTQIPAQTWEFHMAQKSVSENYDGVNARAADHSQWGSNTSRMASLEELLALYAANFNSAGTVGAIQPISNASAIGTVASEANQPKGWAVSYFSAAPTPSGHALVELNSGLISDFRDSLNAGAVAVL